MNIIDKFISVNYSSGRAGKQPIRITCHTCSCNATSLYDWFNKPTTKASTSFYVNKGGVVERYVRDTDTSWGNSNLDSNQRSFSFETWDGLQPNDPVRTNELYESAAQLVAYLCKTYQIPCILVPRNDATNWNVKGIDLHNYFNSGKSCPASLNVNRIINRANQILNTPTMSDPTIKQLAGNLAGFTFDEASAQRETNNWKNDYNSDTGAWMYGFYKYNPAVQAYFVKSWEDKVNQLTADNSALTAQNTELQATVKRQGETIQSQQEEIAGYKEKITKQEEQISKLQQDLLTCEAGNQKPNFTINFFNLFNIIFVKKK